MNLKIKDVPSIKRTDLPSEFSDEAFKIVDEFIRKTIDLNYEILIYFDYVEGKILKCKNWKRNKMLKSSLTMNNLKINMWHPYITIQRICTRHHMIKILESFQEIGKIMN